MKPLTPHKFLAAVGIAGLVLAAGSSRAATISWTAYDITNDVTNVSTNGTLVEARTGRAGTTDVTVNGVTFEAVDNSGNLFDSLFANDNLGARGYGNLVTDSSYRTLLQFGQRSGRVNFDSTTASYRIEPTQVWTTVNFSGLTVGHAYEVQIWASSAQVVPPAETTDGVSKNSALVLGDGSAGTPVYGVDTHLFFELTDTGTTNVSGPGQYGIGTFIADATTQSFNVRQYNNLLTSPTAASESHFSNGWQIRDLGVPVPAPAALPAGLAALGLLAMRRQRSR